MTGIFFFLVMTVNIVINCNDSLIINIVFLKDNWICHGKKTTPKAVTKIRCFKEPNQTNRDHYSYSFVSTLRNISLVQTNNIGRCIAFTSSQLLRDEDSNLKTAAWQLIFTRCFCYLISSVTPSFGRRWGEYRTPWLNQFYYREYLSKYRWVSVTPWQAQGHWVSGASTLLLSGTVREQTARQRHPTAGCYWEARSHPAGMHRWGWFTSLLEPFCAFMMLLVAHLMRLQSPWINKQLPPSLADNCLNI